ncbi:SAC3/GANP/Nin1/mts3/eIF-3 p25 family-domain-containing protein [Hygrophoropsis aurantiaca]|uniref:SAC3/GANP/Nin1/mts3/eIF-3 p25 family-domain-containing protein n=1 Tax=Hygrophoropsis aurantiaca TaxID=72124 RepID=A0ACB8A0I9_9AGAM|nr:SAC3/GANP/Nin1/mts3/eIF-3 p25 family-domain-containing protein [Hygrophoropsis aurantiaca]
MEAVTHSRSNRGRANSIQGGTVGLGRRTHHKNRQWHAEGGNTRNLASTSQHSSGGDMWERGGMRGGRGRGRGSRGNFGNASKSFHRNGDAGGGSTALSEGEPSEVEDENDMGTTEEPDLETAEERDKFWQELVKAREAERKRAIAEGTMDDPLIPKRLEDAITMVGTCLDMCPRFERYRRERENNLFEWETIPGTKRVNHKRAVKMYERAAGDKTLPSDLRPPEVLQATLDYLFHDLMPRGGFSPTFNFIRDRSRAVRNDFTMQHEMGPLAIECHDRCARFHILGLHLERSHPGFSIAMEEQQLMNTLQSLKEFYEDQRGHYQSPTELEMRVYHRLIHIRDQKERHEDIPSSISSHPVFELTTRFRAHVQAKSAPISKSSALVVDAQGMQIFAELAGVLRQEGNVVMIYLVACILERLFGTDTIDDIESIRGEISFSDIIDGYSGEVHAEQVGPDDDISVEDVALGDVDEMNPIPDESQSVRSPQRSATTWLNETFGPKPTEPAFLDSSTSQPSTSTPSDSAHPQSAFSNLTVVPNAFGTSSVFGQSAFKPAAPSVPPAMNGGSASIFGSSSNTFSGFGPSQSQPTNIFGGTSGPSPSPSPFPGALPQAPAAAPPQPSFPKSNSTISFADSPFAPKQTTTSLPMIHTESDTPSSIPAALSVQSSPLDPQAPAFTRKSPSGVPTEAAGGTTTDGPPKSSPFADRRTGEPPLKRPRPLAADITTQSANKPIFPSPLKPTPTLPSIPPGSVPSPSLAGFNSPTGSMSPTQPPPLGRHMPISLPSTPTATVFIPTATSANPTPLKSIFGSLRSIQTSGLSGQSTEILSPLVLGSPGVPRSMSSISLLRSEASQSPLRSVINGDIPSDKLHSPLNISSDSDDLDTKALIFSRKGILVRHIFEQWRERTASRIKWLEACRRSDSYSQKIQNERLSRSTASPTPEKKRKLGSHEARIPIRKRLKSRLSAEYKPPQTDGELVKRFEQNHEEHERRWARGSFLRVLRNHLQTALLPSSWSAWLSLNQENDGTAIWLEQKWDIPNSGRWRNDTIFEIPVVKVQDQPIFPGVIVFERTPLDGVTDQLERKYRILDDCTRLREIIQALPSSRHYLPSLLTISWSAADADTSPDFNDMVNRSLQTGTLNTYQELALTSTTIDLDLKLSAALQSLSLDVEGKLIEQIDLKDLFKILETHLELAIQWLDQFMINGEFDWRLHGKLLELTVTFLNDDIRAISGLLDKSQDPSGFPLLDLRNVNTSDSTFTVVLDWLHDPSIEMFTGNLIVDIQSHEALGREFPSRSFIPHLFDIAEDIAASSLKIDTSAILFIQKSRLQEFTIQVTEMSSAVQDELKSIRATRLRPTPKRRTSFNSSAASITSTPAKRRRLSGSVASSPSDDDSVALSTAAATHPSPSLSAATSLPSEDRFSLVTPAMLRALTKDIKIKYGSPLAR